MNDNELIDQMDEILEVWKRTKIEGGSIFIVTLDDQNGMTRYWETGVPMRLIGVVEGVKQELITDSYPLSRIKSEPGEQL